MDCGRFPAFVDQPSFAGHAFGEGTVSAEKCSAECLPNPPSRIATSPKVTLALAPSHKEGKAMIFAQMADSDKGWSAFDHFETSHLALFQHASTGRAIAELR